MPALTPSFLFDFESEMDRITENEFVRMTLSENQWWRDVTKVRSTGKKREIIAWLLSTAQIYSEGKTGGNMRFDDMMATFQEYDVLNAGVGLSLQRNQVEDNDGNGFDFAAEWSAQVGGLMAWWPQQQVSKLILNGALSTSLAYDGVQYFADNTMGPGNNGHPFNQFNAGLGGFWNWFHGAASGAYPGKLPIDESVTVDAALLNLQIAIAYVASIKMPNGVSPRFLKPRRLMVSPRLVARAQQLCNAKYIAQGATSGGGSGDIEAVIANWGFMEPIEVQEFAGVGTGDGLTVAQNSLTWYLVCEQMQSTQLGGLVYVDREPFRVTYYTGAGGGNGVDAILDRARELEWHLQGRNIAGYGHPYAIFRFDAQ